jgi:hypothetical protein
LSAEDAKGLEDMAGLAILKTLAAFTFPEGEPDFTNEVAEIVRKNARDTLGKESLEDIGIERICEKNPKFAQELDNLLSNK